MQSIPLFFQDVELLYQKIPKPLGLVLIDHEKWNHADFLWAIDNNKYLNDEMLNFIEQSTSQPESLTAVVENSLNKRSGLKAPVDEPFDEVNFLNKFDLSELDAFPKSLSDEQNKTEGLLKTGVNTIKTGKFSFNLFVICTYILCLTRFQIQIDFNQ